MFRETKEAAIATYRQYERLGKKVEWLGVWNGKKFEQNTITAVSQ